MEFIFNIFIISAFCTGLQQVTLEGMLFFNWRVKLFEFLLQCSIDTPPALIKSKLFWLYTIIIGCIFCMASFWGTWLYWVLQLWVWQFEIDLSIWVMWPITCCACVFLNGFFFFTMKYVEQKANH